MKVVAWIALAVIILIILGLIYYLTVGALLFRIIFSKKNISRRIIGKDVDQAIKDYKIDLCWWDKIKFKKVSIQSFDQIKLVGHFFDAQSSKTVIVVHGFGQDYREMQPYCKMFYERNYNVLVVDNRGHGESEGNVGFGWIDRKDILSWIDYLNVKAPENKIVLFGLSMGGTAVCCASGEKLPQNVSAIISDCAFCNADKQIQHIMRKKKFLLKLFKKHLYDFSKRVQGFDIMQIDALKMVNQCALPILFIHGKEDNFVPVENVYDLYSVAQNREKFLVDGAAHAMSYVVAGVSYEKKICDFIKSRTNID